MKLDADPKAIEILDTPRDQDQSPLLNLTAYQRIRLARVNDAFGIDYTEAGFPESSDADRAVFAYFRENPQELTHTILAAFGATRRGDTAAEDDPGLRALLESGAPALVIVGKSSRQQAEAVLRVSAAENLAMIRDTFGFLRSQGREDLTFDAEHYFDGYKQDPEYALEALRTAIEAGVRRVVLCDTKGGTFPEEVHEITRATIQAIGNGIVVGLHMHDDADLATANTLAGIEAGARHYQGTWLGYGERVANVDHSKVLPNLWRRGYRTVPNMAAITPTAHEVAEILQVRVPDNAPFVGADAFTHKAGQHVRGNQRDPLANQFMPAEAVGNRSRSILSKVSGLGNIDEFLARTKAISPEAAEILSRPENRARMLAILKREESRGIRYRDAEASFLLLCLRELQMFEPRFVVTRHKFVDASDSGAIATLWIKVNGDAEATKFNGHSDDGTVDAMSIAFAKALGERFPVMQDLKLENYRATNLPSGEGTASEVQVVVEFSYHGERFYTTGIGTDELAANTEAMCDAIHYCILKHEMNGQIDHG